LAENFSHHVLIPLGGKPYVFIAQVLRVKTLFQNLLGFLFHQKKDSFISYYLGTVGTTEFN